MNRIEMKNNSITLKELDSRVELSLTESPVMSLKITFLDNTALEVYYESDTETKLKLEYVLNENVSVNLVEIRTGFKTKAEYKYELSSNSRLTLYRFNKADYMRELDLVSLNGEHAHIDLKLRTLTTNTEKYDIYIEHNNIDTSSVVDNVGLAYKGAITFNVTGDVKKGSKRAYLDQNNRIVTFNPLKCQINPNLLVDEFDTVANHNALIGDFDYETYFYLMSRGISENAAIRLLSESLIVNGLEKNEIKDKISDYIKEYWG